MATAANFAATPRAGVGLVNTANTNTDGTTGTRTDIFAAGANGSRIDSVQIKGIVAEGSTQAADTVRLWIYNGTNAFFLKEQLIPAGGGVVSATVANAEYTIALGIQLPNGYKLQASTKVGGATASYHVEAFGGDY
jgi:FtsP/CotA-like multicopper oxidase with cupredoxin domain